MNKNAFVALRLPLVVAVATAIAGCAVGPEYQRPALELPGQYAANPANATAVSTSASDSITGKWWSIFKDPVLDRLMEEALANNLDLAVAAARIIEAQAQLGLAISDQVPTIYASASRERNRNSASSNRSAPGQPLEATTNRVALNVSYEIDFWGKYRRATEAARADLLSVEANRDALRLSMMTQAVQGYFNLLAIDAHIAIANEGIHRGQEGLSMQKKRFDAGVISEYDYQQRSAELDAGLAQMPPLQSQQGKQERALAILLGRSPRAVIEGSMARSIPSKPTTPLIAPASLPSELLLSRPDLREAEQKLVATSARIGVARAAYFPSISLTGLFGGESSSLGNLFSGPSRVWSFAGNLTQPLWGAGRLNQQVDAAEARYAQAVAQYKGAIANAFREVQDAIAAQWAAREVFDIQTRRVGSLTKTWNLAKLRYENGAASQLDVIDAERGLLEAEQSRIDAERTFRFAMADLFKALGGGRELPRT
ncbi:MAG: efflux transporter outer membrane subunit [Betaproteobacteria bacterium]